MDLSQHKVDVYCKLLQVSDFRHTSQHCSLTHTTRGESSWEEIVSSARVWTNQAAALGAADVTSWVWQFPIWCKRFRDHRFNKTGRGKSGAPWYTGHPFWIVLFLVLWRGAGFTGFTGFTAAAGAAQYFKSLFSLRAAVSDARSKMILIKMVIGMWVMKHHIEDTNKDGDEDVSNETSHRRY